LLASHGAVGIACWETAGEWPRMITEESSRALLPVGEDRLLAASGAQLIEVNRDLSGVTQRHAFSAKIVTLLQWESHVLVVLATGQMIRYYPLVDKLEPPRQWLTHVTSAAVLPWVGGLRLLLAGERSAVECVGLDDGLVIRYAAPAGSAVALS